MTFGSNLLTLFLVLFFANAQEYSELGIVLACKTAPTLFVSLWGGFLADRLNKKNVASLSILGLGIINIITLYVIINYENYSLVYILSILGGILSSFGAPSLYSLLPFLSPERYLFSSNALVRTFRNLGTLSSPGFYALMNNFYNKEYIGYFSAIATVIAAITIFSIKIPMHGKTESTPSNDKFSSLVQGVAIVKSQKKLFILLGFWAVFLPMQAGLASTIQPVFISDNLHSNTWVTMSFLLSAGYITGSFIATSFRIEKNLSEISILFILLSAAQVLVSALLLPNIILFIFSFLAGIGLEISGVCWGTYLQTAVSKDHIGKVSSLDYAVSFGLIPVGYLLAGSSMSAIGTYESLLYGSLMMIFGGLIMVIILRFRYMNSGTLARP